MNLAPVEVQSPSSRYQRGCQRAEEESLLFSKGCEAGIAERVPMVDRIPQDIFSGLLRQHDARGEDWLMSRGGLGRLDAGVSQSLLDGASENTLDIEAVRDILQPVPQPSGEYFSALGVGCQWVSE